MVKGCLKDSSEKSRSKLAESSAALVPTNALAGCGGAGIDQAYCAAQTQADHGAGGWK